jgi:hypothetical protein
MSDRILFFAASNESAGSEAQVSAVVLSQADLLHASPTTVIPKAPFLAVKQDGRLIASVVIPRVRQFG